MQDLIYSEGKNDECYTPAYAVKPILKFIPENKVVWCPFDTKDSHFVKMISQTNPVIHSHINNGEDFLEWEPKEDWDLIVSNPPFTNKRLFFERALSFHKPFALVMSNTWLNDRAPMQLFAERDLQLLMFDRRIEFEGPGGGQKKITFASSYYCWNFLPKQIVIEHLHNGDTLEDFFG